MTKKARGVTEGGTRRILQSSDIRVSQEAVDQLRNQTNDRIRLQIQIAGQIANANGYKTISPQHMKASQEILKMREAQH